MDIKVTQEGWLIAAAAWNNVPVEQFRKMCEQNKQRMPEGSRAAWGRVFDAVREYMEAEEGK